MTAPDSRGRTHTPAVAAYAERIGVDLATVEGTGVGGRVTIANVTAARPRPAAAGPTTQDRLRVQDEATYVALFGEPMPHDRMPPRPSAAVRRRPVNKRSHFSASVEVTIDVAGINPLLEDAAQTHPCYPLAIKEAEPPTVFNSGNLPPFTASGLAPEILLELPWEVRHYAAASESRAEVLNLVEMYAANPTVIDGQHTTAGTEDYMRRMSAWLIGPGEPAVPEPVAAD